jgi:hypothetical protein
MTTVTSLLDTVTALAKGGTNLLRNAEVFPLNSHSVKTNRVTALPKLLQLFGMAFSTFLRKDYGLLFGGDLVIDMAGHTVDPLLCMLRFHP